MELEGVTVNPAGRLALYYRNRTSRVGVAVGGACLESERKKERDWLIFRNRFTQL